MGDESAAGLAGTPTRIGCRPRENCSPQPGVPTNGRRHSKNSARHTEARRTPPQAEADKVEKTWFLETRATA